MLFVGRKGWFVCVRVCVCVCARVCVCDSLPANEWLKYERWETELGPVTHGSFHFAEVCEDEGIFFCVQLLLVPL